MRRSGEAADELDGSARPSPGVGPVGFIPRAADAARAGEAGGEVGGSARPSPVVGQFEFIPVASDAECDLEAAAGAGRRPRTSTYGVAVLGLRTVFRAAVQTDPLPVEQVQ